MPFIDWSILNSVISDNPGVDFVFIGPNDDRRVTEIEQDLAKRSALNSSNVYLLAKLNSGQLQQYQKQADVLLVAYQEKYHKDQANPHKMMEYLGAGKLIVATFTAEFKQYADEGLFLMSIKNSEFSGLFAKAINELDYWNSEKQQDQRKKVALDNTYDQQINRIEEVIYDKKSS
jgi:glycosyltransferase involved in cell wall biosynthesis